MQIRALILVQKSGPMRRIVENCGFGSAETLFLMLKIRILGLELDTCVNRILAFVVYK